jgi:hypothetical protein
MLGLPRQSPPHWYRYQLQEELWERRTATTYWRKLSKTSGVGFRCANYLYCPCATLLHICICLQSLRWKFYRVAAGLCDAPRIESIRKVINPDKDHKLQEVALRHDNNSVAFKVTARNLRTFWPLLP